ncbi:MAG TPA: hypothetical protein VEI28_01620 [Thermodesulfovibrionales bacterium]|nr:hypothetical protein [Thermodesulfovibrionales bacterium]
MGKHTKYRILFVSALAFLLYATGAVAGEPPYDPLAVSAGFTPQTLDLTVHDAERKRNIPIRVYLPKEKAPSPIVLFSHGLGGSRKGSSYLGNHWAGRGYVVVFIQHPGSDASVWQNKPSAEGIAAMKRAANTENFMLRVRDIHIVLDQLERWNASQASVLMGRLDIKRIGMSGHSFGALTTQAVSGQRFRMGQNFATDSRIKAAIMFSPSSPRRGNPKEAFGEVKIPWMLMTGSRDFALIGDARLESRLAVFPALPRGGKYELVLYGAEHSTFTEGSLPGETGGKHNPNYHRVILALSTAFWDSYLREDASAKDWLDGLGPRSVLEERDRWQSK